MLHGAQRNLLLKVQGVWKVHFAIAVTAARQPPSLAFTGLLGQLDQSASLLASCALGHHLAPNGQRPAILSQTSAHKHASTPKSSVRDQTNAAAATKSMIEQLKVGNLADVIARARATLADVRRKF